MTQTGADIVFFGLAGLWLVAAVCLGLSVVAGWPRHATLDQTLRQVARLAVAAVGFYMPARILAARIAELLAQ